MGTTDIEEVKNSLYSPFLPNRLTRNNSSSKTTSAGLEVYCSVRASKYQGRGPGIGPSTTKISKHS